MPQTPPPMATVHEQPGDPTRNALLAGMAGSVVQNLEPFLSIVSVPSGTVIHEVGKKLIAFIFPLMAWRPCNSSRGTARDRHGGRSAAKGHWRYGRHRPVMRRRTAALRGRPSRQ